ncbi:Hypothetical predicted protein [Cloeon dipterum]|uniref:Uncharacterized protein n=1 Tax=Cloeon dipterum TaxID=197152 RepID=A0A8S1E0P4_9INSE|nr:Hypothetical predicted protein [Cloeon dipterum]
MKAMAVRERLVEKVSAGASRFILAALNSSLQECKEIFEDGRSFQETSDFGCTFLHAAALNKENGFYKILEFASDQINVDKNDSDGDEAIHYAIMAENVYAAELLLRLRSHEINLLHFLVVQNRLELAQLVHEWKKDLIKELDPEGRNALHLAAEYAGKEMCNWIMQEEVFHVNAKTKSGETALHFALKAEKTDIAKDLVPSPEDWKVKQGVDNLLHYCIKLKKLRSVKFVHEHDGELIKEKGQEGKVAIQIAAQFADREIFEWLNSILKMSNKCLAILSRYAVPFIHCAVENQNHGPDIIDFLFHCGANIDRQHDNQTPLHVAIRYGYNAAAEELLRLGADVKKTTGRGLNYLFFCAKYNNLHVAKLIHANNGEFISVFRNQKNVLHQAAETADLDFCKWLVEQGALSTIASTNINLLPSSTLMEIANGNGKPEISAYFKSLGLDKTPY